MSDTAFAYTIGGLLSIFVALAAAAGGGAALRWADLPWSAQDSQARGRRISGAVSGAVVAAVCVALAVL